MYSPTRPLSLQFRNLIGVSKAFAQATNTVACLGGAAITPLSEVIVAQAAVQAALDPTVSGVIDVEQILQLGSR
jgi:hypothetical protein